LRLKSERVQPSKDKVAETDALAITVISMSAICDCNIILNEMTRKWVTSKRSRSITSCTMSDSADLSSLDISFASFEEFMASLQIHDRFHTPEVIDTRNKVNVPAPGHTKPFRVSFDLGRRTNAVNPSDWDSVVITPSFEKLDLASLVVLSSVSPVNVFNVPDRNLSASPRRDLPVFPTVPSFSDHTLYCSAASDVDVIPDSPCPNERLNISDLAEFEIPSHLTIGQRRRLVTRCSPLSACP